MGQPSELLGFREGLWSSEVVEEGGLESLAWGKGRWGYVCRSSSFTFLKANSSKYVLAFVVVIQR